MFLHVDVKIYLNFFFKSAISLKYSSIVLFVYHKSLYTKIKLVIPWRKAHVKYLSDYATFKVSVSLCNSISINTFLSKHKHEKKYYSY